MTPENIVLKLIVALIVKLAELIGRLFDRSKPFSLSGWMAETSEVLAAVREELGHISETVNQVLENTQPPNEPSPPWPEGSVPVTRFIDPRNACAKPWVLLTQEADYDAAKNHGDREAACRIVKKFLDSPENSSRLKALRESCPDAVIMPARPEGEEDKNCLPAALAEYLAGKTGLELDAGIEGEVKQDRPYLLAGDIFDPEGSLNETRLFIERNGGRVAGAAALTLGGQGRRRNGGETLRPGETLPPDAGLRRPRPSLRC